MRLSYLHLVEVHGPRLLDLALQLVEAPPPYVHDLALQLVVGSLALLLAAVTCCFRVAHVAYAVLETGGTGGIGGQLQLAQPSPLTNST